MGYQRNKYSWCDMNKNVNGKQFAILWHLDYLNMLHVDSDTFLPFLLTWKICENDHHTG